MESARPRNRAGRVLYKARRCISFFAHAFPAPFVDPHALRTPHKHVPRSVLVTGGAGFIGSNFLLRMVPRYPKVRFVNLDSLTYAGNLMNLAPIEKAKNYVFAHGDIADRDMVGDLFREHAFSTVVHFAAESHVDRSVLAPLSFIQTNVLGTATLLEEARAAWNPDEFQTGRYRFHHVSTDEVYGSLGPEGLFSETTPYDPRSPYSASKASADHFARSWGQTYGLPVVVSNCSNNYGPRQFPEKLVPLVIVRAMNGNEIPIYGKGENIRDWLFVEDHCEALETILLSGADGETYGVGGETCRTNLELVHMVLDRVDRALNRPEGTSGTLVSFVKDRPGHDYRYAMDTSKLRGELGWRPRHDLLQGIDTTIAWYLENEDWLQAVLDESWRTWYNEQYVART